MFQLVELVRGPVLDIDQGDGVAGVGNGDSDAPAHAARAETSNSGSRGVHGANPSRNRCCSWFRSRYPNPNALRLRPFASSLQTVWPIARKAFANGVATPASSATETRNDRPRCRSSNI